MASFDPSDAAGVADRIKPIGEVAFGQAPVTPINAGDPETPAPTPAPNRAPSSTFVTPAGNTHVTLNAGGTVSDVVALQNKAGNPITAEDIRASNPGLNINAEFSNVPAGATLQVPVRIGDTLVTDLPSGGTQSVNTKTHEIATVVPNGDGTTTQTTSATDGEFTRTVRSITYDGNGEIQSEQRYAVNTLDNTRTTLSSDGTLVSTTSTPHDAATQQILDAFENPPLISKDNAVLLADAGTGGIVSDAGTGTNSESNQPPAPAAPAQEAINSGAISATPVAPESNPNNFGAYLGGQGASLTPAQQDALAAQLDGLGLGGDADLSFYALPDGGVLIGNADGDIVGELNHGAGGDLNLRATSLNAQGSAGTLSTHIGEDGGALSDLQYSQYQASQLSAGLGLVNSLGALQNWEGMNDLGHLSTVVGLYNNLGTLSNGGTSALGDLGGAASVLGLISAIDSGNGLAMLQSGLQVTQMGLNLYSNMMASSLVDAASSAAFDAAAESALSSAAASSVIGEALPYVGALMALDNFGAHPFQSIGAIAGMYFGPIGSMLGSMIGGLIDNFLGGQDTPPPPAGSTHYDWDAEGNIQIRVDQNISGGGDAASKTAHSLQDLLNTIVKSINDQNPDSADNVALNPYLLPKVGFSGNSAWIETTAPGGAPVRESVHSDTIAQRLLEVMTDNGALAPAWQVQTQLTQHQTLVASGASAADINATLGADAGGHAAAGNQAYAIQGHATESADFKTQSFGALVVHLGSDIANTDAVQAGTQALQQLQDQQTEQRVATSDLYRDTEGDGYYEKTRWVSAKDAHGKVQCVLVLDYNGTGQIETRDILNLGGNAGQAGNLANDATQATANAHLQRNNVEWFDANGDGVLDASDPAFAAIRLWVDVNQDGIRWGKVRGATTSANQPRWSHAA